MTKHCYDMSLVCTSQATAVHDAGQPAQDVWAGEMGYRHGRGLGF